MTFSISRKTSFIIDFIVIPAGLITLVVLQWLKREGQIPHTQIVTWLLLLWYYILYQKRKRLLHFMSGCDVKLVDYFGAESTRLPSEYKSWEHCSKKWHKLSSRVLLIFPVYLVCIVVAYILQLTPLPKDILTDMFFLFALIYITVNWLSLGAVAKEFIGAISRAGGSANAELRGANGVLLSKRAISKRLAEGSFLGIVYVLLVYHFLDMRLFEHVLHYLAFSILYFLTWLLINMYRCVSRMLLVLGIEWD